MSAPFHEDVPVVERQARIEHNRISGTNDGYMAVFITDSIGQWSLALDATYHNRIERDRRVKELMESLQAWLLAV